MTRAARARAIDSQQRLAVISTSSISSGRQARGTAAWTAIMATSRPSRSAAATTAARLAVLVQQGRRVLEQTDDAAVLVDDVELDVGDGPAFAGGDLERQLIVRQLVPVQVEDAEAGRALAIGGGLRGVLSRREAQR